MSEKTHRVSRVWEYVLVTVAVFCVFAVVFQVLSSIISPVIDDIRMGKLRERARLLQAVHAEVLEKQGSFTDPAAVREALATVLASKGRDSARSECAR